MNESFVSIYLASHGTDSSNTMSLFNFGFSSKKNDKGGKENVEDRPSFDIQSENVDQAPAVPGDVATGSGASAAFKNNSTQLYIVLELTMMYMYTLHFQTQTPFNNWIDHVKCNNMHQLSAVKG